MELRKYVKDLFDTYHISEARKIALVNDICNTFSGSNPELVIKAINAAKLKYDFCLSSRVINTELKEILKSENRLKNEDKKKINYNLDEKIEILDNFYNNLSKENLKFVKRKSMDLMLEMGMDITNSMIKNIYENAIKYMIMRELFAMELSKIGYIVKGFALTNKGWVNREQYIIMCSGGRK